MSVDFSNVKVGDRIKLTRENGDEVTIEVEDTPTPNVYDKHFSSYWPDEWDTLEILEKVLPEVPTRVGAMLHDGTNGHTFLVLNSSGDWLDDSGFKLREQTVREFMRDGWKVVFEGLEYDA